MNQKIAVTTGIIVLALIVIAVYTGGLLTNKSTNTGHEKTTTKQATITGSGSSFIAPQLYAWSNQVKGKYPWLIVEYESVGSGAGLSNFIQNLRDFCGSDPPMPHDLWMKYNGKVVQMPVILGAVTIVYNIPGVNEHLNLTGEIIAGIYKGDIKYWDDEKIKSINPNVNLPHKEIIAVHRSDSSGTTNIFTLFLHKSAPNVWPQDLVAKSINLSLIHISEPTRPY
jgi:phosphate transport system substrate-binding protein